MKPAVALAPIQCSVGGCWEMSVEGWVAPGFEIGLLKLEELGHEK